MVLIYILLYFLVLVLLYILIIKRLKLLSERHYENTGIKSLSRGYRIVRRKMIFLLILLFILGSLVLLIFMQNGILRKIGLYNDQKTLDNNAF